MNGRTKGDQNKDEIDKTAREADDRQRSPMIQGGRFCLGIGRRNSKHRLAGGRMNDVAIQCDARRSVKQASLLYKIGKSIKKRE